MSAASEDVAMLKQTSSSTGLPKEDFNPVFATFRRKDVLAKLEWKDIELKIGKKQILNGLSGEANPGELVAIMGPSGGGKTTLLNALSGRIQSGGKKRLTGTVTLNGKEVKPMSFRKRVAYVTQEDALFATATVRESLELSCRLRLPANTSREDREHIVTDIITSLGLTKCEHSMIGSERLRGVSGGEKKRVAIGVELVSNPSILFLDEPTSGLDSYSSYNVVRILQSIARVAKATIIASIHQPSAEVFHLFDTLILLGSGNVIYQGPVTQVEAPFNKLGIVFPARTNVADYVLMLVQTTPLDQLPCDNKNEKRTDRPVFVDDEAATGEDVEAAAVAKKKWLHPFHRSSGGEAKPGVLVQAWWLMVREFKSIYRNKPALIGRFGATAFLNVLFAILFIGAADQNKSNYSVQSHFGALVQIIISSLFGAAQPALLTFPLERIIFIREKATGTYGTVPYMFAKLLVELPLAFITALISLLINYWAIGFSGNFFLLILCMWGLMLAATSTAMVVGSVVSTPQTAQQFAPLILVPQLLFLGLFIRLDQMPVWISWAQYLCSAKYGLNLAMIVEFNPDLAINADIRNQWITFMNTNQVYADQSWLYSIILIAIFAGFRILSLLFLNQKASQLGQ